MANKLKKTNVKSIVLLSGGLDSLLACKILQEQTQVSAFYMKLPFSVNREKPIKNFCKKNKINLFVLNATKNPLFKEYINLLKKPKYSRGKCLNMCIDCHAFTIKKAKKLAKKFNIEIIATGDVLGERPLSQNKQALKLIEKETKLNGKILRPLSAKKLDKTEYEKKGLIDREKLLGIQGRKRTKQIQLAKKCKIKYPNPAGGCLLCDKKYCEKLKLLLDRDLEYADIKLLSLGRHFEYSQIILGKNKEENELLEKEKGIKIIPKKPGPTALIRINKSPKSQSKLVKDKEKERLTKKSKKLINNYSKHEIDKFEVIN